MSLVGVFKAKPNPLICRGLPVERLVRLFELETWREINVILLDFCGLSLVSLFNAKTFAGDLPAERLLCLFEFKTWR